MKTLRNEKSRNTSLLDSPDQNITGIPVSDFMISGDSILYKIGVASASFRGIIDRDRKVIRGVLTQRGDNYPLDLFRKDIPFFTPKAPKRGLNPLDKFNLYSEIRKHDPPSMK
jgi:hypothetical protein